MEFNFDMDEKHFQQVFELERINSNSNLTLKGNKSWSHQTFNAGKCLQKTPLCLWDKTWIIWRDSQLGALLSLESHRFSFLFLKFNFHVANVFKLAPTRQHLSFSWSSLILLDHISATTLEQLIDSVSPIEIYFSKFYCVQNISKIIIKGNRSKILRQNCWPRQHLTDTISDPNKTQKTDHSLIAEKIE